MISIPDFKQNFARRCLEEQVRQHNEKKAAASGLNKAGVEEHENKDDDDDSYEVNLDEDFLKALEYGMPLASGVASDLTFNKKIQKRKRECLY